MGEFQTFSFEEEMHQISSKFKILPKFTSYILTIMIKRPICEPPYHFSVKSEDKVYVKIDFILLTNWINSRDGPLSWV